MPDSQTGGQSTALASGGTYASGSEVTLTPIGLVHGPAKCDVCMAINVHAGRLILGLSCDGDVFTKPTVERMTDSLQCLVHGLLRNSHATIESLPMVPPEQLQALQHFSCGPLRPDHLEGPLLHEAFTALAEQHPSRRCLVFEGAEMSYGQVNAAADALAAALAGMGVVRGTPVGIMLDRSFELVIAILGVLKAGGGSDVGLPLPVLLPGC